MTNVITSTFRSLAVMFQLPQRMRFSSNSSNLTRDTLSNTTIFWTELSHLHRICFHRFEIITPDVSRSRNHNLVGRIKTAFFLYSGAVKLRFLHKAIIIMILVQDHLNLSQYSRLTYTRFENGMIAQRDHFNYPFSIS